MRPMCAGILLAVVSALAPMQARSPLPERPRLLLSKPGVPAIRRKIERQAWARRAMASLKRNADAWLDRPVKLPDRGGQWSHWYSCKRHGARLRTESPTRHVCPIDGEVYSGYPYDDVILTREHDAFADGVRTLGVVYQLTGDGRYAARAREILLAYAARYLSYPLHNNQGREAVGGGRITSQTLNEAIWIIRAAQGADAIWDRLSSDDRETLKDRLFYPAVDVIRRHRLGIHNIQCWKNSAVGLVGYLYDDPSLIADAVDSPHGYRAQMNKGVNADGQWYEGAWGYHFYTMDAVWPLTEAARNCGVDLYGNTYQRMFLSPILLAMPDGALPAFNDSNSATAEGNPNYETALARYGDQRIALAIKGERQSLQALLFGRETLPRPRATGAGSANYPASGYAVLSSERGTESAWLCLKYGPHGGGHGHPDKNSFVLYAGGAILAGDPGTAAYGVPIQSAWYRTTLAHNTIAADEASQVPATGRCLEFRSEKAWHGAVTDAGPAIAGLRYRRCVAMLDGHVAVFADFVTPERDIASASAHTLDLAYHPEGAWAEPPQGEAVKLPDKPGYSHIRGATRTMLAAAPRAGRAPSLDLRTRRTGIKGEWWVSVLAGDVPTGIIVGTGVGRNTEDRVPIVIARRQAVAATYVWAVGLKAGVRPHFAVEPLTSVDGRGVPSHEACSVSVTYDRADVPQTCTWRVVANPDALRLRFAGTTTSARIEALPAAVRGHSALPPASAGSQSRGVRRQS